MLLSCLYKYAEGLIIAGCWKEVEEEVFGFGLRAIIQVSKNTSEICASAFLFVLPSFWAFDV